MADDWAKEMTDRIGDAIRDLREPQSVQWLEDRTYELGHRVSRSTVNELENGRRKSVTLADVIVLAAALNVPVGQLIYPLDGPAVVEALPGLLVPRADAIEALGGTVADIEADRKRIEEIQETLKAGLKAVERLRARHNIPPLEQQPPGRPIKLDELRDGG